MRLNHRPLFCRIPPELLEVEEVWSADLFCGLASQVLLAKGKRVNLHQLGGNCLEGWRVSTNQFTTDYDPRIETTPIYRQANLDLMRLRLDEEHWQAPKIEGESWCVKLGDVVLNKLVPIRAAVITPRTYRHPIDSNCILIRGLQQKSAVWVAICLNQPPYEAYLTQHEGLAVLPRASLQELRRMRVPPPPEEMEQMSHQFWTLHDSLLSNEELLIRGMTEVNDYLSQKLRESGVKEWEEKSQKLNQGYFFSASLLEDSLLPKHLSNAALRNDLLRHCQWLPIAAFAVPESINRMRWRQNDEVIRVLQLKDVVQDLMVEEVETTSVTQATRIFEEPLAEKEVLLSTLVSSPRVVFVEQKPQPDIYVSDHWHRLRFLETPGAWAMILNSSILRQQLVGLAMGTAQQFTTKTQLDKLLLPNIPLTIRQHWHDRLLEHHQKEHDLQVQWRSFLAEAEALFLRELGTLVLGGSHDTDRLRSVSDFSQAKTPILD